MKHVNIFYRIFIFSWVCFFKTLFSGNFADQVYALSQSEETTDESSEKELAEESVEVAEAEPVAAEPKPESEPKPDLVDGLYLLSLFQKHGRLVDFLQQDIQGFSNEEVGEAVRVVHEGCVKVVQDYLSIEAIYSEEEGAQVKVEEGYDPNSIRLSGNVSGNPPFDGELIHHGWKVTDTKLPKLTDDNARYILAPAEIESR